MKNLPKPINKKINFKKGSFKNKGFNSASLATTVTIPFFTLLSFLFFLFLPAFLGNIIILSIFIAGIFAFSLVLADKQNIKIAKNTTMLSIYILSIIMLFLNAISYSPSLVTLNIITAFIQIFSIKLTICYLLIMVIVYRGIFFLYFKIRHKLPKKANVALNFISTFIFTFLVICFLLVTMYIDNPQSLLKMLLALINQTYLIAIVALIYTIIIKILTARRNNKKFNFNNTSQNITQEIENNEEHNGHNAKNANHTKRHGNPTAKFKKPGIPKQ